MIDKFPRISIIMPSFNHNDYIGLAIESALKQTYKDFEFLISDDSSTDGSQQKIKSYANKDARIKYYFQNKQLGAVGQLHFLINQAKGEFIALLNSDDLWDIQKLSVQIKYMEQHKDVSLCFTHAVIIDELGVIKTVEDWSLANIFIQNNRTKAQWIRYFWDYGNCLAHPSLLIRKKIFDVGYKYNASLRQLPDFELWTRLIQNYNFYIIPLKLTYHRRVAGHRNTSAETFKNFKRLKNESAWILKNMLLNISDELLIEGFSDQFIISTAYTKVQLQCERYFLLRNKMDHGDAFMQISRFFFYEHADDEEFIECMKSNYYYTINDFYLAELKHNHNFVLKKLLSLLFQRH